jgi:hypothetical protein
VSWWMEEPLRMIQCNLRETDGGLDPEKLVQTVKGFDANTLMVGAGGISAFYPTELPFQRRNPYLKGDLLGELTRLCHRNGLRLIARFDFSKADAAFLPEHPDWFYQTGDGRRVVFNGMAHTCVNGRYQRELSLEILREVLERYPVDGIFFNMFGYQTRDYSERYYGLCQCENCKARYLDFCGRELPSSEEDPDIGRYRSFQKKTVSEMLDKIHATVKSIRPEVAVCTYTDHQVDIIRSESNTALSRPLPQWLYSASDQVMRVRGSFSEKVSANCAINAADIFWRFMGVSPSQTRLRLWENLASGGGLDFCIIGVFDGYPETAAFAGVREVFSFQKAQEKIFAQLTSLAEIVLIYPEDPALEAEYRGIFRMLKEAHLPFDVVKASCVADRLPHSRYRLVILPGVGVDPALLPESAAVIATSGAFTDRPDVLKTLFGAETVRTVPENQGAYLLAEDKSLWKRMPERDRVLLAGLIRLCRFAGETALPYLPPAPYGPPECCELGEASEFSGLGFFRSENHVAALLPWDAGRLYDCHGFLEHRDVLLDTIDRLGDFSALETDAPPMVETFLDRFPSGELVQLINLTGFNGSSFFEPLPVSGIHISVRLDRNASFSRVTRLRDGAAIPAGRSGDKLCFTACTLAGYDAYRID